MVLKTQPTKEQKDPFEGLECLCRSDPDFAHKGVVRDGEPDKHGEPTTFIEHQIRCRRCGTIVPTGKK